jgi:CRISPR-associated protein Csm3
MTFRDRGRDEQIAPKPYTMIDLPADVQIDRRRPAGHETIRQNALSGRIELTLEALSPVHVGSGLLQLTEDTRRPLMREMVRVEGVPVIPGSSFKGCVRAIAEAMSASCVRVTRTRDVPRGLEGCRNKEQLCIGCQMFGAQDYQAPLRFGDLRLRDDPAQCVEFAELPQMFRPRPDSPIYRGRAGRKFYMHGAQQAEGDTPAEVCRTGSIFQGSIDFVNLEEGQLGLLLVALGQDPEHQLFPKLGGAKPACYGTVRVGIASLKLVAPRSRYVTWDAPEDRVVEVASYITASRSLVLSAQLAALAETLRWPNERDCPSGLY